MTSHAIWVTNSKVKNKKITVGVTNSKSKNKKKLY